MKPAPPSSRDLRTETLALRVELAHHMGMATTCGEEADGPGIQADVAGNRLHVIEQGPDLRDALMTLISEARRSLQLYYYIFADDGSGRMVRDALVAARRRGVDVTLMVDAFGSSGTASDFFASMEAEGIRVGIFGRKRSTRYLIRNHQKMAIADGSRILIGGFNVSDDYFGLPTDNCWHDVGLIVEGDAVAPMVSWFGLLDAWTFSPGQRFRALRAMVRRWRPGTGRLRWLVGGPTRKLSPWAQQVKHDLQAGRRLDMVEAYFSPGRGMLRRIGRLARREGGRGRDGARLILPSKSDNGATVAASRFLYAGMLRRAVELYEYMPCRLHMKLIVIDDVVYVGSANFDMRSLFLNLEVMLRIEDAAFARAMRAFIDRRVEDSERMTLAGHRRRQGLIGLVTGWLSYLLVGVADYTVTRRLNFRARD